MRKNRCENCVFWLPLDSIDFHRNVQRLPTAEIAELCGLCRRRSPRAAGSDDPDFEHSDEPVWPWSKLADWCGEFQPLPPGGASELEDDENGETTEPVTTDLWYERFAELLGCDPRPGAIAASIEELGLALVRAQRSIGEHRQNAVDNLIREMRKSSCNCGPHIGCGLAGRMKTSDESSSAENKTEGG